MKNILNCNVTKEFKKCGIYLLKINTHLYIGSSINIQNRILHHKMDLLKDKHCNLKLQNAFNKYKSLEVDIIELCSVENRTSREKYWIDFYKADLNIILNPNENPVKSFYTKKSCKKVYQYDLQGNFIKEWNSVNEAERFYGKGKTLGIGQAARGMHNRKSIKGFQWSYQKKDYLESYKNNSNLAVNKHIYVFDIILNKELSFNSISEACKTLFPSINNFDSKCASISSCCCHKQLNIQHYIFRYENDVYYLPKRKSSIIDLNSNTVYKNKKELKILLNLSDKEIKYLFQKNQLQFINDTARIKLCESGKPFKEN